jgi:hypothetical protein
MPAPPDPGDIRPVELSELRGAKARETPRVRPMPAPQGPASSPPAPEPPKKRRLGLMISGGTALAAALAVAAWFGFDRLHHPDESPAKGAPSLAASDEALTVTPAPDEEIGERPSTSAVEKTSPEPPAPPPVKATPKAVKPPAAPDVRRALYSVIVSGATGEARFRLGTAWAVAPKRLVTSGAVVMAIEELQKSGMSAVVSREGDSGGERVAGLHVHPAYRRAFEEALVARQEIEKARLADKPSNKGPRSDVSSSDAVTGARERLDSAYAAQADCDVGLLDVDQTLDTLLTPLSGKLPADPFQCKLAGLPFPVDQYRASEPGPADRVQQFSFNINPGAAGSSDGAHLILQFGGVLARRNWSGSPILNPAGRVIGVYSRPLPALDGDTDAESDRPVSHAVTPIARLREMAPELK